MTLTKFLGFSAIMLTMACGGAPSSDEAVTTKKESKGSTKVKKSCLEEYAMQPDKLLSLEQVAEMMEVDPSLVKAKPPLDMFDDPMMRAASYKWDSDRKIIVKTAAGSFESDVSNSVIIGSFRLLENERRKIEIPYTEWFENTYRQMTDEEKASFNKQMDEKLKEKLENDSEVKTAKTLGGGIMDIAMSTTYESIDGIGDRAIAERNTKYTEATINVLHGNLTFLVKVDVSDDRELNLAKAKELAKAILAVCD